MNFLFNGTQGIKTPGMKRCVSTACLGLLACLVLPGVVVSQDEPAGIVMEQGSEILEKPSESLPTGSLGISRNEALIASLTIFSLAVFVGFEIITKVPPTLHTPLMSGSNAISGITLVGAALVAGGSGHGFASFLGMSAVALAAVNVVGGFMVTDRMLSMFQKKKK